MNIPAIDRLNELLRRELGSVASGTLPRFAWKHSSEIPMVEDRIGGRWLLTEWRRPSIKRDAWDRECNGRWPYPAAGCYHPYLETALPVGMVPTSDLTQKAICQFDRQMRTSFEKQMREMNAEIEQDQGYRMNEDGQYERLRPEEDNSRDRREWIDYVQGNDEAFCNPVVGRTAFPQFMGKKASEGFVGI